MAGVSVKRLYCSSSWKEVNINQKFKIITFRRELELLINMKGDLYLLYLAIIFVFVGVYTLIYHKSTEDPMLNLQMGIVVSVVGLILILLFVKQITKK